MFPHRFQDEVSWAFKMFDVDNSGMIVVEEIHDSVRVRRNMYVFEKFSASVI